MDFVKLASAIDGASEGSEHLDFVIQRLFGLKKPIPSYTRSVDAAILLIPADWSIRRLARTHNGQGRFTGWTADLYRASEVMIDASVTAQAATAPLAICASALRALEAMRRAGGLPTAQAVG